MHQCVPNFLSSVFAKYYLNWFTAGKVITKIKRVNFLLRDSVDTNSVQPLSHNNPVGARTKFINAITTQRYRYESLHA